MVSSRPIRHDKEYGLVFIPYLYYIGCCSEQRICSVVIDRAIWNDMSETASLVDGNLYLKGDFPGNTLSGFCC